MPVKRLAIPPGKDKDFDKRLEDRIEQQRQELAEREEQLNRHTAELIETRNGLVTMQQQLAHAQQEVAVQREELLAQLGGAGSITAPATKTTPAEVAVEVPSNTPPPPPSQPEPAQPKAASTATTEQFRKMRRDAKRRAIGV